MVKRKVPMIILAMMATSLLVATCNQRDQPAVDPRGNSYAGSASCMHCHQDLGSSTVHTNHFRTSAPVTADSLRNQIRPALSFYYPDSSRISFDEKDQNIYQVYHPLGAVATSNNIHPANEISSGRFDLAFGSGEKARTYAGWNGSDLMELPLSWYAVKKVCANSPGFPMDKPRYNRIIPLRCFECHASFVKTEQVQSGPVAVKDRLDKSSIVYGIDCERCHGPGADHVAAMTGYAASGSDAGSESDAKVKRPVRYGSINNLSRDRQLDLCASCHSGNEHETSRSLFGFVPGDTLSRFYYPSFGNAEPDPDVHGNQLQLLQSSRCYQAGNLTCGSCHSLHKADSQTETFTAKCMACHQSSQHATKEVLLNKASLVSACVNCHMPMKESRVISFNSGAGLEKIPYFLRTHKIAIYAP